MSSFTIRVELHDANWQHYVDLAKDLASKGITDVITADSGTRFKMSPAEYDYVGSASIAAVHDAVVASATKVGRRHAVFVTEAVQRKWTGLQPIPVQRTA